MTAADIIVFSGVLVLASAAIRYTRTSATALYWRNRALKAERTLKWPLE